MPETAPPTSTSPDVAITEGFPSTDMSKKLLDKLQAETKTYKRNRKASGAIFGQSCVAYGAIIDLIKKIDGQNSLESLPWDDFDKSVTGTTELEAFLLELLFDDHDSEPILPPTAKLQESLQFVKTWAAHHDAAVQRAATLDKWVFEKAKLLVDADRAAFKNKLLKGQRQDHIDTLDGIDKDIQANKLADTDIQPQAEDAKAYVKDVKTAVSSLSGEVKAKAEQFDYSEEHVAKVVAGAMLLHIPFVVSQVENDAKTDGHIKSVKIWSAAKDFAEYLARFLEESSDKKEELDKKYDAFEKLLLDILDLGGWIPQILTMMRLSANVRRPFYSRSVALVKMWYTMNKNPDMKDESNAAARQALIEAIGETTKAIQSAKTDITAFETIIGDKVKEVEKKYDTVLATVKVLIDKYASADKAGLDKAYTDAQKIDEEHLKKYRAKLTFKKVEAGAVNSDDASKVEAAVVNSDAEASKVEAGEVNSDDEASKVEAAAVDSDAEASNVEAGEVNSDTEASKVEAGEVNSDDEASKVEAGAVNSGAEVSEAE